MRLILLRHQVPKIEYHVPYFTACIGTGSEPVRFWFWGLRTGSQIGTGSGNRAISATQQLTWRKVQVYLGLSVAVVGLGCFAAAPLQ